MSLLRTPRNPKSPRGFQPLDDAQVDKSGTTLLSSTSRRKKPHFNFLSRSSKKHAVSRNMPAYYTWYIHILLAIDRTICYFTYSYGASITSFCSVPPNRYLLLAISPACPNLGLVEVDADTAGKHPQGAIEGAGTTNRQERWARSCCQCLLPRRGRADICRSKGGAHG